MVRITLDLIRKRAEHNEGEIGSLEEISLHQENIEKIEVLNQNCRNLKILLMQNNLISKIENLNMLKRLEYLNLAINNIEVIENLEGLESLQKLDLTVNFIGDLRSVDRLRHNKNLEILYLTGNPCTDYTGYREFVVATLEQLSELDATKIERSERILAVQNYASARDDVVRAYGEYSKKRQAQIDAYREKKKNAPKKNRDNSNDRSEFWKEKSLHTPEERIAIAEMSRRRVEKSEDKKTSGREKRVRKLVNSEGRPYNMNEAKVPFTLDDESDPEYLILEVRVYRHLDSSHLEVDVQPDYVRVLIKGKMLQLCLPCEVSIERSEAKRNSTTGNLVIKMPRLERLPIVCQRVPRKNCNKSQNSEEMTSANRRRCLLEIGPPKGTEDLDFSRIYKERAEALRVERKEKTLSADFVDDPDVPPLE
ncbi:dynein axonemal assembly factor 11 [Venturia canescens]|uniref:dynein axonemal assembly factor 11 n=1 Tax=Venturia canescens TaxID=32260 RepID=UPI001C9C7D97|nr:dynein axonemal assembly factor 11 [Venturia canescens]